MPRNPSSSTPWKPRTGSRPASKISFPSAPGVLSYTANMTATTSRPTSSASRSQCADVRYTAHHPSPWLGAPLLEQQVVHTSSLRSSPRPQVPSPPLFPRPSSPNLNPFGLVLGRPLRRPSVVTPGGAPHVCYCLTPMRYAWDQFDAYFGPARLGTLRSALMRPVMARMARWDRDTADRVDRYALFLIMLRGGLPDTIIARLPLCIHQWTRTFFTPTARRRKASR